jgi:hypothetical protein
MDRGIMIGSISGLAIFIVLILIIFFNHSDFNQNLISSVAYGTPADQLIPQIEQQHSIECTQAKNNLAARMMSMDQWGNGDLTADSYSDFYTQNYKQEIKYYNDLELLRIKFVKRQISKEEFLNDLESKNFST